MLSEEDEVLQTRWDEDRSGFRGDGDMGGIH